MYWLIGGTKDARDFLKKIAIKNIIISVATEYGKELLKDCTYEIIVKRLDKKEMKSFVKKYKIKGIIDLSHPYAIEVSKNAIEVGIEEEIPYFRYERKLLSYNGAREFFDIDDLVKEVDKVLGNKKVLSTLGSNSISKFKEIKNKENFYARILPMEEALVKCREARIISKNILAMQGPFSKEFNIATLENYNIDILLTKESGYIGGEFEKVEACKALGVEVFVLKRPKIEYPRVFDTLEDLIEVLNF